MGIFLLIIQFLTSLFSFQGWTDFIGKLTGASLAVALFVVALPGCQPNAEPIERMGNQLSGVMQSALSKAATELSARTSQMQGQGSLINPGYEGTIVGGVGPTFFSTFALHTTGVSANVSGATQSDAGQAGTVAPPVSR